MLLEGLDKGWGGVLGDGKLLGIGRVTGEVDRFGIREDVFRRYGERVNPGVGGGEGLWVRS